MHEPPSPTRETDEEVAAYGREIRGLDWRFLLPGSSGRPFGHLVLLGATPRLARHAVALGVASEVSRELPADRSADAVVRLHGASVSIGAAAGCLRPGGVFYAEVERGSWLDGAAAPGRVRRTLTRAGVVPVETYWCLPDFERHVAYVPLSSPGAIAWYLGSSAAASRRARVRGRALRALASLGPDAAGALIRRYAITGTATGVAAEDVEVSPSLLGHPGVPADLRRPGLRLLLIAPGNRRIVLLPFTRTDPHPVGALKVSREGYHNARARDEQRVLEAVYGRLDATLRTTIPRPYGCVQWGELLASVEGGLRGRPLTPIRNRALGRTHCCPSDLPRVAAWLAEFHRQTEFGRIRWSDSPAARTLESSCAEYQDVFEATPRERALLALVRRRTRLIGDAELPLVWTHGDLHGGNILRNRDGLGVIDWVEGGVGPPVVDLCNFVLEWVARVEPGGDGDGARQRLLERLLLESEEGDPRAEAVHRAIGHYVSALGIDRRLVPVLWVLFVVDRATLFRRKADQRHSATFRNLSARYAGYVRTLAARPEALFDRWWDGTASDRPARTAERGPSLGIVGCATS